MGTAGGSPPEQRDDSGGAQGGAVVGRQVGEHQAGPQPAAYSPRGCTDDARAALELIDGLKARGLVDRALVVQLGQCRLELQPPKATEAYNHDAEMKRQDLVNEELQYGSS